MLLTTHIPPIFLPIVSSTPPLEVAATAHDRNALIHDRLADPEVVLNPLLDRGRLGEGIGLDTRTGALGQIRLTICGKEMLGVIVQDSR